MSFISEFELGRSCKGNIKNWSWDVHPCYKLYEEEGKAIVTYINELERTVSELKAQMGAEHE